MRGVVEAGAQVVGGNATLRIREWVTCRRSGAPTVKRAESLLSCGMEASWPELGDRVTKAHEVASGEVGSSMAMKFERKARHRHDQNSRLHER